MEKQATVNPENGLAVRAGDRVYIPAGGLRIWINEDGTTGVSASVAVDPWLPDMSTNGGTSEETVEAITTDGFPVKSICGDHVYACQKSRNLHELLHSPDVARLKHMAVIEGKQAVGILDLDKASQAPRLQRVGTRRGTGPARQPGCCRGVTWTTRRGQEGAATEPSLRTPHWDNPAWPGAGRLSWCPRPFDLDGPDWMPTAGEPADHRRLQRDEVAGMTQSTPLGTRARGPALLEGYTVTMECGPGGACSQRVWFFQPPAMSRLLRVESTSVMTLTDGECESRRTCMWSRSIWSAVVTNHRYDTIRKIVPAKTLTL